MKIGAAFIFNHTIDFTRYLIEYFILNFYLAPLNLNN